MKAVTSRSYGPPSVLRIDEIARPTPKANEVLVQVHASTVTSGDVRLRATRCPAVFWLPIRLAFGLTRPRNPVPGMEFAGVVAAVGAAVSRFRVGDPVFGMRIGGANAEYLVAAETGAIAVTPDKLSFEQAAATPFGALSALEFVRDFARIKPGHTVLIHGASGAVGVFAVQLARHFGAHVTGVCSGANVDLVKSIGADVVIDYTKTDFSKGDARYDVILDTVGGTSFSRSKRVLAANGRHVFVDVGLTQLLQVLWTALGPGKRAICGFSEGNSQADLLEINHLIETGKIKPVIDRTYTLHEIVDAHAYVDTGRKRGSVVISVAVSA
jgi:NADPH:quinone reductase-like Zn-dependent oxidoreductase